MTARHTVRDWLLLAAEQYNIDEVYHNRRPDDENIEKRPHLLYWFDSSADGVNNAIPISCTTRTSYDDEIVHIKPFVRTLVIQCVDHEDGMDVLESISISVNNPDINDIFYSGRNAHNESSDDSRIASVTLESINNITEHDETDTDHLYEMRLTVRLHSHFTMTRENSKVDDLTITGTVTNDNGDTDTLTVTDTIV